MSEFRSHKWISSGHGKALNIHKVPSIFGPVAKNPCNLISIFGRARQGKSFLMNCLAGEREIFKISNEKDSCTQGIDISSKWLGLSDFSKLDGGKHVGGRTEGIKIGFVDAEGQGDKDVSYDANLICPILLASKCVIFNWKGDLQKDHILSTLGIMARAAQNIATESTGATRSKFGHLHIIFRDWQAVKTDEEAVFRTLLGIEGTAEATTRDLIRTDLLSSFESIKVWLFDAPSEYTKDLKQKLVFERTSDAFRTQVRALREALSQQLKEPTYLAGSVLVGRSYIPFIENIADALNTGQVVLPSSAYLNMMRQEALQLTQQYDAELRTLSTQLLEKINLPYTAGQLFDTRAVAVGKFTDLVDAQGVKFQTRIADIVGNVAGAPGSPVATILSEYAAQTQEIHRSAEQQFLALYHQHFSQWLMKARKAAERLLEMEAADLEARLPIHEDSASGPTLAEQLQNALEAGLGLIGGTHHYGADCGEVVDAENILRRHFNSLTASLQERNTKMIQQSRGDADAYLANAMRSMEASLEHTVQQMTQSRPSGYLMQQLEVTLNQEYHTLKAELRAQLAKSLHKDSTLARFDADCGALRARMIAKYNAAKESALSAAIRQAGDSIEAYLHKFDVNHLWRDVSLEECESLLETSLQQLAQDVEKSMVQKFASGWLLTVQQAAVNAADSELANQVSKEHRFLADLHSAIQEPVTGFRAHWATELERRIEAEAEAEAIAEDLRRAEEAAAAEAEEAELEALRLAQSDVSMQSDGEEDQDDRKGPAASKAKTSAAEQRAKAAEWALKQYGASAASKTTARGKKAPAAKPVKTVEQQRADALAYAKILYGEDIGEDSPVKQPTATGKRRTPVETNEEEEEEEEENMAYRSSGRKQASVKPEPAPKPLKTEKAAKAPAAPARAPAPVMPPAAPVEKVDPVKAARAEAQRQAQERAAAAATAAAERASKAKAARKK